MASLNLELVKACQGTYTSPATVHNAKTGTYVVVTKASDGLPIVAFRGSVTPEDWFRDFNTFTTDTRVDPMLGYCHAGFLDAVTNIIWSIEPIVKGKRWYLTGHSLGGALAVGLATITAYEGWAPKLTATFGAPRFGGRQFRRASLKAPIIQYRYGNDPVPNTPLYAWPFFIYVNTRPPLAVGSPMDDAFSCHHIENYVGALKGT